LIGRQNVEFRINKGALGLSKDVTHYVLEYQSPTIAAHATRSFSELHRDLQVPIMPPTMSEICRVIEICYTLKVAHFAPPRENFASGENIGLSRFDV